MELLHGCGGSRLTWPQLPVGLRAAVESALGSAVVHAASQPGGFSPGAADRVRLADGRRVFVKAVGAERDPTALRFLCSEIDVLCKLPPHLPAPRLLAAVEDGDWVAVIQQDLDGRPPALPWRSVELDRVLAAAAQLVEQATPSPVDVPSVLSKHADSFTGWRTLAAGHPNLDTLPAGVRSRLDRLAALEAGWAAAAAGDTLQHGDLRADNVVLTADRAWLVDWPHAFVGAPWLDVLCMLPSVLMQGGAGADQVWCGYRPAAAADPDAVNAVLAAVTGYFFRASLEPVPRHLPGIRRFQRAQGEAGLDWLLHRTS